MAVLVQSLRIMNSKETRALSSMIALAMSWPTFGPLQQACKLEEWRDGLLCISETTTKPVLMHTTENHPHQHSSITLSEWEIQGFFAYADSQRSFISSLFQEVWLYFLDQDLETQLLLA